MQCRIVEFTILLQVHEAGSYIFKGYAKLKPPAVRTTTFHSFRHLASNAWNKLSDTTRKADALSMFRNKLKQIENK